MNDVINARYALQTGGDKIPQGNLSTVRRAVDLHTLEVVAVKFVQAARDEITERMFEREVGALQRLKHPNIVGLRDHGIDDSNAFYLVLDWVDFTLEQVLADKHWDSWSEFYPNLFRPILSAISHAHLNNTEHRDIKPANILIDAEQRPLVADFGIATLEASGPPSSQTVQRFRSVPYAPPEQEARMPFVRDVFSLGVLAVQCMTDGRIADYSEISPALTSANLPDGVRDILRRCVEYNSDLRPTSAAELEGLLEDAWQMISDDAGRQQNTIWFDLSRRAMQDLELLKSSGETPEMVVARDLAGPVHAEFGIVKENGSPDRSWMFLYGASHRYSVTSPKVDGDLLTLRAVTELDFEAMEHGRRRSLALPAIFRWETRRPTNLLAAARGWRALQRLLDAHLEAGLTSTEDSIKNEQFDLWGRVLDARSDLARGSATPMPYRRVSREGRRATFSLTHEVDTDLIGTFWEASSPDRPRRTFNGEVIEQQGKELTVLLTRRTDSVPARGILRPYDAPSTIAISRQRRALFSIRDGNVPNDKIRDIILEPAGSNPPDPIHIDSWQSEMDHDKQRAIELAVGNTGMMVVEGPPGTGKTRFIAELVYQILRNNPRKRILIASQTNAAVDNALERINNVGLASVVRLAGAASSVVDPAVHSLLLEHQLPRWADEIRSRALATIEHDAQKHGIPVAHAHAALLLQQVSSIGTERTRLEARLEQKDAPATETVTGLEDIEQTEELETVLTRIDLLDERRKAYIVSAQAYLGSDLTLESSISTVAAKEAISAILGSNPDAQAFIRRVELQAQWMDRIESDNEMTGAFLATTSVVAGTCVGLVRHKAVTQLEFDVCIVDEASRATLTEAVIPISRAKQWIIVGDTRQLPPSDEELIRKPEILAEHNITKSDVVETLFQRLVDHLPSKSQVMLRSQYRMIRPIGKLISDCFYDGLLQSPRTSGIPGYDMWAGAPVTWLDTSAMGAERREATAGSTSIANRAEAKLLVEQIISLDAALERGLVRPNTQRPLEVLAIAPYMSQVEDIRRRVAATNFKNVSVITMSVDAVQGREADIAFFSVTRSNANQKLGFLGPDYWRRINVALSRARFGLMIIGDADFIRSQDSGLSRVLAYVEQNTGDCQLRKEQA